MPVQIFKFHYQLEKAEGVNNKISDPHGLCSIPNLEQRLVDNLKTITPIQDKIIQTEKCNLSIQRKK
jgi:hypothetical protein